MQSSPYPILEFDPDRGSILDPSKLIKKMDVPEHAVICFFAEVIEDIVSEYHATLLCNLKSEIGVHPIYEINFKGKRIAFFHPGIGAPLAIGLMEEVIALGVKNFIACGGCGVLDKDIAVGHLILPTSAIRDEGTSYHYSPPSREIKADPYVVSVMESVLIEKRLSFVKGKTWTTDAIYRETQRHVEMYRNEGCLVVEMETAAFIALAEFRKVRFGQYLYGGDAVLKDGWNGRDWHSRKDIRKQLFLLSAETVLKFL